MWSSIIMQENNFVMPGVVVGAFFLECLAQSHQLCSVESPSNGLVRFEQLIRHQADPTKYTTWVFFHEYSAWLSMLKHGQVVPMISSWVIVVDPFFTSDYTMQKTLSFMPGKQHFICEKSAFNVFRLQFIWNPIAFESFSMISNDMKLFVKSLLM